MSDRGPTRILFTEMSTALKVWVRDLRAHGRTRGVMGRGAAAAAAVTLAAGMAAAPAVAAPGDENQNAPSAPAASPEGTQLAARGVRPGARQPMYPQMQTVPRRQPPNQPQQPIPTRPRQGPLDPATREQLERGENLRDDAGRFDNKQGWDKLMKDLDEKIQNERKDRGSSLDPDASTQQTAQVDQPGQPGQPGESNRSGQPAWPPPLTQQQVDTLNEQIAGMEPPGYVNQYPELSPEPGLDAFRSLDRSNVERQISQSYLNDPRNRPVNQERLDGFRSRFNEAIDGIHGAGTVQEQQAARDRYNEVARDFNRAELNERDNFGGHQPGDRTVPKHMSDPPARDDQQPPPEGPVEQGLPPERTQSPRNQSQADPNVDGTTDAPAETPAATEPDSARSIPQNAPSADEPVDTAPQPENPEGQVPEAPEAEAPEAEAPEAEAPTNTETADDTGSGTSDVSGAAGSDSLEGSGGMDTGLDSGSVADLGAADPVGADSGSVGADSGGDSGGFVEDFGGGDVGGGDFGGGDFGGGDFGGGDFGGGDFGGGDFGGGDFGGGDFGGY